MPRRFWCGFVEWTESWPDSTGNRWNIRHPFISIGGGHCGARQRRSKKKNDASKTPLEDMSNVAYDVPDQNQRKCWFPNLECAPLETMGWASTDSWTRASSTEHGDVRSRSNFCVSNHPSREGFPFPLPWRWQRSRKRWYHDGGPNRDQTSPGLWARTDQSSSLSKRSTSRDGRGHHTFPH